MTQNAVVYIAGPNATPTEAEQLAKQQGLQPPVLLRRRGTALGWVAEQPELPGYEAESAGRAWTNSEGYALKGFVADLIAPYQADIQQACKLMEQVAEGAEVADLFEQSPYIERTTAQFELLSAFQDEGDDQEIETVEYDAVEDDEVVAENLWCKASWLSFEDDDASLRFRFSFGMVGYEDVAADYQRQHYAAQLTDAIFPESAIISQNKTLEAFLCQALNAEKLAYVERIIYFNAPNGGAQFHQDVERGHLGVVFAQIHGRTGWLACSKAQLIDQVQAFVADPANESVLLGLMDERMLDELKLKAASQTDLNGWLDERDNDPLELLLNRCPEFYKVLFDLGYGYLINEGDIILLPQKSIDECCWHTVFCIDDFPGESLSFAIRTLD